MNWKTKIQHMKLRKYCLYLKYVLLDSYRKALTASFVEDCIPGRYVSEVTLLDETVRGTLTISCLSSSGNVYEVSYNIDELTIAGNLQQTKSIHRECWLGYYDPRVRLLVETTLDKVVSFVPERRAALYGARVLLKTGA